MKPFFYFLLIGLFATLNIKDIRAQQQPPILFNSKDSGQEKENIAKSYLAPRALIISGSFLAYGALKPVVNEIPRLDQNIMNGIKQNHAGYRTTLDDYLMWAPSASIFMMDAFHIKTVHNFRQHIIIEAGSVLITGCIGMGMRMISKNMKAYNSNGSKFPSGHTANAFRGAEIFHQEFKESNRLLSYGAYLLAMGVGISRLYEQNHYLSEVVAGAGLGILSAKLTYWIFDKAKKQ